MKRKNLLYIFADQWRYHAVGQAGEDPVRTPNMDAFAARGLSCLNAVSSYPLCSPHRAALMTGKHALSCGMWTNCKTGLFEKVMLDPQEVTITDVLAGAGYDVGYIGKWHLDAAELNYFKAPESGAAVWDAYTPPGERRHSIRFWHSYGAMDNHLDPHYWEDSPRKIKPGKWSAEHETDVLLDFLRDKPDKDKPFACFLSWNPPHPPYDQVPRDLLANVPEDLPDRGNVPAGMAGSAEYKAKKRQYFAAVEGLDREFGRIMDYLESSGLAEDTYVVLSADHGDCMGSHGVYGKNIWWEESIRIPFYMTGPGVKPGTKVDSLLASEDHMPTILDILGLDIPSTCEGVSLRGAFLDGEEGPRSHVYLCMLPGMPELVDPYMELGLESKCFGWRGIRTKGQTYVIDNGTEPGAIQKRHIWNNLEDPLQLNDEAPCPGDPAAGKFDRLIKEEADRRKDPFLIGGR